MPGNSQSTERPDKIPPQDIEAEKSLIGSLMIDKNAIFKVADFLRPDDFYSGRHKDIYEIMEDLFSKGEPIDLIAISTKLKEKELLESIGGTAYLTELINTVPTASHVVTYGRIVQKKRILRDLITTGQDITLSGYNENEESDQLLDQAEKMIFSITQKSLSQSFSPIKSCLKDAFERIDRISKNQGKLRGVRTGFTELDNMLAGLQKSDLIILAARPSMGKSSLAMDIAKNIAVNEKLPVGIFSLEMSKDQLVDRMIASHANLDLWRLRTGRLSSEGENNDFTRIQYALGALSSAPIYIDDASFTNILQMRAMARRLQSDKGLGLLIVDYLQLIDPRNSMASPVQQMAEISRALKGLARELNIPVLALSQLSRAVETRIPQIPRLADLRDSGAIEQDADIVLFIYREDRYRPETPRKGIADIIIAKHRNGPVGKVEVFFDEQRASFRNLDSQHQESSGGESSSMDDII
ncbi:MAG: replicative DNA helicase [Candidatus Paceibacterota bacterium]